MENCLVFNRCLVWIRLGGCWLILPVSIILPSYMQIDTDRYIYIYMMFISHEIRIFAMNQSGFDGSCHWFRCCGSTSSWIETKPRNDFYILVSMCCLFEMVTWFFFLTTKTTLPLERTWSHTNVRVPPNATMFPNKYSLIRLIKGLLTTIIP